LICIVSFSIYEPISRIITILLFYSSFLPSFFLT
jgi:hypothetical protein